MYSLSAYCLNQVSSFYLWHAKLGHMSSELLKSLVQSGVVLGKASTCDISECRGCKLEKMYVLPSNKSTSISSSPLSCSYRFVGTLSYYN